MIGADLERLVTAHDQTSFAVFLVLQKTSVASAALLPLSCLFHKLEELGAHLEHLLLRLLVGFGLDLLRKPNDGLEVDVFGFGCLLFLCTEEARLAKRPLSWYQQLTSSSLAAAAASR